MTKELNRSHWDDDAPTDVDLWLKIYAQDDNLPWATSSGHLVNIIDELIDRLQTAKADGWDHAWQELRAIPHWYNREEQRGGFDLGTDGLAPATEEGAYMEVKRVMDVNPYKEHVHVRVSSFGDPYCMICRVDLPLNGENNE